MDEMSPSESISRRAKQCQSGSRVHGPALSSANRKWKSIFAVQFGWECCCRSDRMRAAGRRENTFALRGVKESRRQIKKNECVQDAKRFRDSSRDTRRV